MILRALAVAVATMTIVAAGGIWWFRAGADTPVKVDEFGDRVQTVPRGQLPAFATTPEVARLYRFATDQPQAFAGVECTCGCTRIGHVTNRFCYVKAETAAEVTYTSHAAT